MMKRTLYKDLLEQQAYFLECGTCERVDFTTQNIDDNTVMLEIDGEMFKNVHLYDEVEFEDTLIILNGRYFEAFIEQKLSFKA